MTEEQPEILIEYPDVFPISGPLREVFTERLKTFFQACDTWSCSHDGSLPEKLLKLRREMQESIDYPPVRKTALAPDNVPLDEGEFSPVREDPEARHVRTLVSPEVRISWKGLQTRSMEKLPPAVRDAGLDLASRVLGVHIRYGRPDACFEHRENAPVSADADHDMGTTQRFAGGTENRSLEDRARCLRSARKLVGIATVAGLIIGMALGIVVSQTTMPHHGGGYSAQRQARFYAPLAQPSRSAMIAPSVATVTPQGKGN